MGFWDTPIGARPHPWLTDELGNPVLIDPAGRTYTSQPRTQGYPDWLNAATAALDPMGRGVNDRRPGAGERALAGLSQATTLPGLLASIPDPTGPTTYGDAIGTAMGLLGGGAAGSAPAGALRAGPLRVAHGSRAGDITELRPSERGALGPGVYGTPSHNVARQYAGDEGHVYEFTADNYFNGLGRSGLSDGGASVSPAAVWREETARLVEAAPESIREELAARAYKYEPYQDGYSLWWDIRRLTGSDEAAQDLVRRAGFNGYSAHVDGPEVVMFDPVPLYRGGR